MSYLDAYSFFDYQGGIYSVLYTHHVPVGLAKEDDDIISVNNRDRW